MNIIAFSGFANSGKDTCADFFVSLGYKKKSFANPIKEFARSVFSFSDEQLWGPSSKRNDKDLRSYHHSVWNLWHVKLKVFGPDWLNSIELDGYFDQLEDKFNTLKYTAISPRTVLQQFGDFGRDIDPDVWVKKLIKSVDGDTVVSDLRFLNELQYLKKSGSLAVRVNSNRSKLSGDNGKHKSETSMLEIKNSDFDFIINNDGTLDDLFEKLLRIKSHVIDDKKRYTVEL